MKQQVRYTEKELPLVAAHLAAMVVPGTIITFAGLLGAGKTTLIQELGKQLGIVEYMPSPTYGYVAAYKAESVTVYHFDLYRLAGVEDFEALGFHEYLNDPHGVCCIEWAERIEELLVLPLYSQRRCLVSLAYCAEDASCRELLVKMP